MAILPNYTPGSKRPRDPDLNNNDSPTMNKKPTTIQPTVASAPVVKQNMIEIKEVLENTLDGISTIADKEWAFGGPLLQTANPGLTLPKSGIVGFPLSVHDAIRIRDEACGSFGNGANEVAGGKSCWTMSAEEFGIRNPGWNTFVKDFVWETFGASAGLYQIDLVELRLEGVEASECGQVGVPYSASTAAVAKPYISFLVYLPSMHTGGLLKYSFESASRTFDTSASSEFDMFYVASYSDALLSSLPIQSGYRLLLEYRIKNPEFPVIKTARSIIGYAQDFEASLQDWTALWKANQAPPLLVYILDDSPEEIKANKPRTQYLQERCATQGVCAYRAFLRSTVHVDDSHDAGCKLEEISALDGSKVPGFTRPVDVELSQIIQTDPFEEKESNDSDYEPDPCEEVYENHFKDPVLVIMPEEYRSRFFAEHCKDDKKRF